MIVWQFSTYLVSPVDGLNDKFTIEMTEDCLGWDLMRNVEHSMLREDKCDHIRGECHCSETLGQRRVPKIVDETRVIKCMLQNRKGISNSKSENYFDGNSIFQVVKPLRPSDRDIYFQLKTDLLWFVGRYVKECIFWK